MEKMIQALFNTEVEAFKGLKALQQLDLTKEISIGETYVLSRDIEGKTSIRSATNESEGIGVLGGGLLGGLVGLLAGPLGFIVGVAGGMIAGSAGETLKAEGVSDYLDNISANIPNGKSVLIAHVWEDWEAPVDAVLLPISTDVRRFNINDHVFVPAQTELDKINEDIKEAENQFQDADAAEKLAWEATLTDLIKRKEAMQNNMDIHIDHQEKQYNQWVDNHPTDEQHDEERRLRLENRINEQKSRLEQIKRYR